MSDRDLPTPESVLPPPPRTGLRLTILALFFITGACGLVYEVVWMRMLTLIFGATAFATSTILASFFTGLALGGAWFGRVIDRGGRPLRVYALLEAGVGAFAFLMPLLLSAVTAIYVGVARSVDLGFYGISAVRFVLAFLVLVLPATLMGGSLPVILKFFARNRATLGRQLGSLYALNTLGAVVGAMSAGFFLILWLGVREAAYAAGVLNLLIAGVALLLDRRYGAPAFEAAAAVGSTDSDVPTEQVTELPADAETDLGPQEEVPPTPSEVAPYSPGTVRLTLWAIGIAGFCALALEVFWTRALVYFLDNSTHAFTTILVAFLLGIGLGSLVISAFIDRARRLLAWLGVLEILIGVAALLAIPTIQHLTPVFETLQDVELDAWLNWKWMGVRFARTLTVVLVPTLLMGMAFPIAGKIYTTSVRSVGTALGNVYAVNTIGGVFGSLVAGFFLIPLIGVQAGIVLVAALNVLVGVVLLQWEPGLGRKARSAAMAASVVVIAGAGWLYLRGGPLILSSYYEGIETQRILKYEESIGATVKVYEDIYGDRLISINGFPVAGEPPEYQDAQKGLGHFPLLLTTAPSPTVGIIGFGAGGTSWSVLRHREVNRVDCVELVPAVPRQAHYFPEVNHGVRDLPRYNLIFNDGRNHALVTDEVYDVISVDATSPKMAGNGSLYTRDFYELLDARLAEDGIAVQWIPHHLLSDREVRMTAKSFLEVFPHASLWFSPLRQNMVLIGTKQPLRIDVQVLIEKMSRPAVRQDLANVNIGTALDFLGTFVMGGEALADFVGNVPVNTDNHPYLEFTPAMAYFVGDFYRLRNILDFREARQSVVPFLDNLPEDGEERAAMLEAVNTRYDAVSHSLDGDILRFLGERRRAMEEYNEALTIDPLERNWLNTVWRFEGR